MGEWSLNDPIGLYTFAPKSDLEAPAEGTSIHTQGWK